MPRLRSRTSTAESGSRLQAAPEPIESARIVAIGGIHRHKRNRKKKRAGAAHGRSGANAQPGRGHRISARIRRSGAGSRAASRQSLVVYARNRLGAMPPRRGYSTWTQTIVYLFGIGTRTRAGAVGGDDRRRHALVFSARNRCRRSVRSRHRTSCRCLRNRPIARRARRRLRCSDALLRRRIR